MANIIEYSGYIGTIEYSQEDKYFFGKIDMINDLVTFEAQNATQLEENFKNTQNLIEKVSDTTGVKL